MRVVWTARANKSIENIFTCSRDFYSKRALKDLNRELKHIEGLLPDNPLMGAIEPIGEGMDLKYRHIVLSFPFKLIYFIWEEQVFIADIWDTRQSPDKQKSHLE